MKNRGTAVTFYRRPDGSLTGFVAQGHAGYAQWGRDIVCAAISALTQAALGGLTDVIGAPVMFDVDEQTGYLEAQLAPEATSDQILQAQILLRTLQGALEQMQRNYPQNVRIFFEERR